MALIDEIKPARLTHNARRQKDQNARLARRAKKAVRLAVAAAACETANQKPNAARPYLERAVAALPASHRIVAQARPGGVQRLGVVHKSDAMAEAVMGRLPARNKRSKERVS